MATERFKEKVTDWVIGWKTANLLVNRVAGKICFTPLFQFRGVVPYQVDDVARCQYRLPHVSPGPDCRCGFNAFASIESARNYIATSTKIYVQSRPQGQSRSLAIVADNLVMLRVGLYGRVVEGLHFEPLDFGYKAERQRIGNVFVPTTCGDITCRHRAELLGPLETDPPRWVVSGCTYLRPLCGKHANLADFRLSLDDCSQYLKVPVVWDEG